jgi:hypothetical protein
MNDLTFWEVKTHISPLPPIHISDSTHLEPEPEMVIANLQSPDNPPTLCGVLLFNNQTSSSPIINYSAELASAYARSMYPI